MKTGFLVSLFALAFGLHASAWVRDTVTDEQAVAHAQVIVVARLKEGSLVKFPKDQYVTSASAVLVVTKMLKGPFSMQEIPMEIAYGLSPESDGDGLINTRTGDSLPDEGTPKGQIRIHDTRNSILSLQPITGDLNADQVWLLRVKQDGTGSVEKKLRVWDPGDIQPLSKVETISNLIAKASARK